MVYNIGKDLGLVVNHELTKTTARVKVLLDGLKPIVKRAIIEYDSGEESMVYLEYEKLENHCSICNSFCHLKKDCPDFLSANLHSTPQQTEGGQSQEANSRRQQETLYGDKGYLHPYHSRRELALEQTWKNKAESTQEHRRESFHDRVDCHGNSYGDRVATKQTRVPPPVREVDPKRAETTTWKSKPLAKKTEEQVYKSPPYSRNREGLRSREAYNHPKEAAARRQRVLSSEAEGLLETTATSILQAAEEQRRPLSPWELGIREESPPGIDFETAMQPSDKEETPQPTQSKTSKAQKKKQKLKSVITTPNILKGMSTRKRNLSQMRFSPAGVSKSPERKKQKDSSTNSQKEGQVGPSTRIVNPSINLIPAAAKRKADFRFPPTPAP
ncbi:uncharacterized protein LOC108831485 [Raphanus sativus]|uniref:Uncharacterized protein LOC108831485 n=1 Tax=Raphanus sativus TaxID=3726 RepID=A0A6J0LKP2_RAPSA|nr:uncharacterized protein LOC108831485 [Raphanus sativus]